MHEQDGFWGRLDAGIVCSALSCSVKSRGIIYAVRKLRLKAVSAFIVVLFVLCIKLEAISSPKLTSIEAGGIVSRAKVM